MDRRDILVPQQDAGFENPAYRYTVNYELFVMLSVNSVKQSDAQRHPEEAKRLKDLVIYHGILRLRSGRHSVSVCSVAEFILSEVEGFLVMTKRLSVYTKLPCSPLGAGFFIRNIFKLRIECY
ncbi:MAG: hypothetical protein ACREOW_17400 [Thermodesulfobacteriota bacterium]